MKKAARSEKEEGNERGKMGIGTRLQRAVVVDTWRCFLFLSNTTGLLAGVFGIAATVIGNTILFYPFHLLERLKNFQKA
ncbi:hypothetical protein L2E82_19422 [Cichorium intybus]|uniref:Uncharacterized protein n=1 Tax=Cichorium intybus TaxID=13427 RepID=A0ACB9FB97_CICIN|nr:hypothetical protein L2E82_19422 [Cichorium intybus]